MTSTSQLTIGVFDSGFGGLTVLRALLPLVPQASFVYLGDTARLPYGSKSPQTIARYAIESARFLHQQGADLLVIACNTATALALAEIQQALPIPVIGVIEPGAQAAAQAPLSRTATDATSRSLSHTGQSPHPDPTILVLATTATVQSRAYTRALAALGVSATEKACPLLVPLVEEGWLADPAHLAVTREVLRLYLTEAFTAAPSTTTLLLGCTHYPLLTPLIEQTLRDLNHPLHIIDSAHATAETVARIAAQLPAHPSSSTTPTCTFYATDSIEKFEHLGSAFLGHPLPHVHLIDLGG